MKIYLILLSILCVTHSLMGQSRNYKAILKNDGALNFYKNEKLIETSNFLIPLKKSIKNGNIEKKIYNKGNDIIIDLLLDNINTTYIINFKQNRNAFFLTRDITTTFYKTDSDGLVTNCEKKLDSLPVSVIKYGEIDREKVLSQKCSYEFKINVSLDSIVEKIKYKKEIRFPKKERIEHYLNIQKPSEDNINKYNDLALLLHNINEFDVSTFLCNKILEKYPNNEKGLLIIGDNYYEQKKYKKASTFYNKYINLMKLSNKSELIPKYVYKRI